MSGLLGNFAIDLNRPKLKNPDGSFSTEETITIESGGKFYNIPTIVRGVRVNPDAAVLMWRGGDNPHVGEFGSMKEAVDSAKQRSGEIGRVRGLLGR